MTTVRISGGVVHSLPADLRKAIASETKALAAWEDITPLARNEWICWTISVKKDETRRRHVERVCSELKEGMRRPCCWPAAASISILWCDSAPSSCLMQRSLCENRHFGRINAYPDVIFPVTTGRPKSGLKRACRPRPDSYLLHCSLDGIGVMFVPLRPKIAFR